ncbi:Uu.00g131620.m01.CDS01 [Anthostomella pinea]|uniref:Uu.00g131620.m01.CDS01 n=1 Tax=Anthostomella pinea TaxID=933095 RepID=A0AAI8VIU7_9PEZI|nr:Uu.00g131620.m01.CDS01 [Anthostomella pinea]
MADSITPQTPPRKLFKPSIKTKTPTPVRRPRSGTSTSAQSTRSFGQPTRQAAPNSAQKGTPDAPRSGSVASQSTGSLRKPALDDVAKSTTLAPLTDASEAPSGKLDDYAASDTTGDTPIGLVDHDVLTPTDTASRSTDTGGPLSRNTSDTLQRTTSSFKDKIARAKENSKDPSDAATGAAGGERDGGSDAKESSSQNMTDSLKSLAGNADGPLEDTANDLMESMSNSTEKLPSPSEMAKFFSDQGHSEMSSFIQALLESASEESSKDADEGANDAGDSAKGAGDGADSTNDSAKAATDQADQRHPEMNSFIQALLGNASEDSSKDAGEGANSTNDLAKATTDQAGKNTTGGLTDVSPNPMEELPNDDNLVAEPNERAKQAIGDTATDAKQKGSDGIESDKASSSEANNDAASAVQGKASDVSKKAEGATNNANGSGPGVAPTNKVGEPDTSSISEKAQVAAPKKLNWQPRKRQASQATKASDSAKGAAMGSKPNTPNGASGATQSADNMGQPAHIQRRIDIPLQRSDKGANGTAEAAKPGMGNSTNSLGDVKDLPGTDDLYSPDDLDDLPNGESQDPPEEILDPSVHSSSNITPIPQIPKVASIGSQPPLDLARLARGLGGHTVDDVGNIVNESGKVLGHATGDLPAMVGKKVSDDGEVYGNDGDVVGYVSENFTEPPPPADIPSEALGGLKVDHEGNILDSEGNIIGQFHQKPGANGALPPFANSGQTGAKKPGDEPAQESKPSVNAHTGGSPSDIFLDVKSTNDGIQLTIRIPTTFSKPPKGS